MKKLASWLLIAASCIIASSLVSRAQIVGRVVDQIIATTCTNQFVRSLTASGAATCAAIAAGDFPTLTGDVTTPGGSLATTLAATARLKSKMISGSTKNLADANGATQAITGMGFQPTTCFAVGGVASSITQYVTIFGMGDSSRQVTATSLGGSTISRIVNAFMIYQDVTGANFQIATITSYDSDGLTLTWAKTGTPAGTATFDVMCYR